MRLPDLSDRLADPAYRDLVLMAVRTVERDRTLLGVSPHFITVGKRS